MSDLSWVKEIKETTDDDEANKLLKKGWRLIAVKTCQRYVMDLQTTVGSALYVLGR